MRPLPLEAHKRQKTSAGPVLKQNLFCRHRTRPALVGCVLYAEHRLFSYSIHLQSHPPLVVRLTHLCALMASVADRGYLHIIFFQTSSSSSSSSSPITFSGPSQGSSGIGIHASR